MEKSDEKFKQRYIKFSEGNRLALSIQYHASENPQELRITDALRTYATWLVRATRRKMAASGPEKPPENSPKNEVELT